MTYLPRQNDLLQIPIWLVQTVKKGKISLNIDGLENVQVTIENNKADINFLQKELLKTLLQLQAQMNKESILKKIKNLKNLAEKLRQDGFTITISHKNTTILTLGAEANPTISQLITETKAIQINNLIELIKLAT